MEITRYLQFKVYRTLGHKYRPSIISLQQVDYIIRYIADNYGVESHQSILERLLELADKHGVKELNKLYLAIKLKEMNESGRYSVSASIPIDRRAYDRGRKVC